MALQSATATSAAEGDALVGLILRKALLMLGPLSGKANADQKRAAIKVKKLLGHFCLNWRFFDFCI